MAPYRYRSSVTANRWGRLARNLVPGLIRENPIAAFATVAATRAGQLAYKEAKREAMPFVNRVLGKKRPNVHHTLDEPSQSRARGMPRPGPGYWNPTRTGRPDPDDPSRPWKKARTMPAYRRSKRATGRAWKSKKKKRYMSSKGVTNVFDDHNEFTDPSALYVYTQDHGSSERAIRIGAQAVLKAALATIKVYPASMVDTFNVPNHNSSLDIFTRRSRGDSPTYESGDFTVPVDGRSFEQMTGDFVTGVTSQIGSGYLPVGFAFKSTSDSNDRSPIIRQLGDSMIYFSAKSTLRLQNTTHADGAGNTDLNHVVDANPLRGKVYYTKGFVPYIKDHLVDVDSTLLGFHESNEYGINKAYENFPGSTWNHPPAGTAFFKHCSGSRHITMKPGSILPLRSTFSAKMKVSDFFKKAAGPSFVVGRNDGPYYFGKCTVVALEQSMRSQGNEAVDVAINRELVMRASCVLKTRVPTLSSYISTDVPATV